MREQEQRENPGKRTLERGGAAVGAEARYWYQSLLRGGKKGENSLASHGRVKVTCLCVARTLTSSSTPPTRRAHSVHTSVLLPRHPLPGLVEGALDRRRDELEGLLDVLRLLGRGLRVLHPELLRARKAAVTSAARKAAASSRARLRLSLYYPLARRWLGAHWAGLSPGGAPSWAELPGAR